MHLFVVGENVEESVVKMVGLMRFLFSPKPSRKAVEGHVKIVFLKLTLALWDTLEIG